MFHSALVSHRKDDVIFTELYIVIEQVLIDKILSMTLKLRKID